MLTCLRKPPQRLPPHDDRLCTTCSTSRSSVAAPAGPWDEDDEPTSESSTAAARDEEACGSSPSRVEGTGVDVLVASGEPGLNADSATRSICDVESWRERREGEMSMGKDHVVFPSLPLSRGR